MTAVLIPFASLCLALLAAESPDAGGPRQPTAIEEIEAAALAAPAAPAAPAAAGDEAPGNPPGTIRVTPQHPSRPVTHPRPRRVVVDDEGTTPTPAAVVDQAGFAIELSTAGFASGGLQGGLFLGGRTAGGIIIGGILDASSASIKFTEDDTAISSSATTIRLGVGVRHNFVRTADRRVDLFGGGDVSVVFKSAEIPATSPGTGAEVTATGLSLAYGPGLRLWVHEQIAIGYTARLRLTYFSGPAGALMSPPSANPVDASSTELGFDGTFQVLGVF